LKVWFGFTRGLILINIILFINYFDIIAEMDVRSANNESSEVVDILLPVTFYLNPSTRLDNVKNL